MNCLHATKRTLTLAAMAVLYTAPVAAQEWKDSQGRPVAQSDAHRIVSGLGGWLFITPEKSWLARLKNPSATVPVINTTDSLRVGEEVTILIMLANPGRDATGKSSVLCDLRVMRPNRITAMDVKGLDCLVGPQSGDPMSVRLASQWLAFKGEATDPPGMYAVEVRLQDTVGNVTVPLKGTFTLAR